MNSDDRIKCAEASKGLSDLRESIARLIRTPRVLIIDDAPLDVELLIKAILNVIRCDTSACPSPVEGLNMFKANPFDAVFLDLVIPGFDPLDFLRSINIKNVVVIVTGYSTNTPLIAEAVKLGAIQVITKPVKEDDLRKIFGGINGR